MENVLKHFLYVLSCPCPTFLLCIQNQHFEKENKILGVFKSEPKRGYHFSLFVKQIDEHYFGNQNVQHVCNNLKVLNGCPFLISLHLPLTQLLVSLGINPIIVYPCQVCKNGSFHLRGNVYIQYKSLDSALLAYNSVNGRYFAGKQVMHSFVLFVPDEYL